MDMDGVWGVHGGVEHVGIGVEDINKLDMALPSVSREKVMDERG
jgi:hypothetical protein